MEKIFLLTLLILTTACGNDKNEFNNGQLAPILGFSVRLVDSEGNWIEGIEEKEMKLLVADSDWNILKKQSDNNLYPNPFWRIEKDYNYVGNGKEEFVGGKKELL